MLPAGVPATSLPRLHREADLILGESLRLSCEIPCIKPTPSTLLAISVLQQHPCLIYVQTLRLFHTCGYTSSFEPITIKTIPPTFTMADIAAVLLVDPIRKCIVHSMPRRDLSSLSKTTATFRHVLLPFLSQQKDQQSPPITIKIQPVAPREHDLLYMKNTGVHGSLLCAESQHTRGDGVRDCRICSKPICEACIIKTSFSEHDKGMFSNRIRSLCPNCYDKSDLRVRNISAIAYSKVDSSCHRPESVCFCAVCHSSGVYRPAQTFLGEIDFKAPWFAAFD